MSLATNIRTLRQSRGLTQQALADRIGVSHVAVSHWETGRNAVPEWAKKHLARVLGTTVPELTGPRSNVPAVQFYREKTQ